MTSTLLWLAITDNAVAASVGGVFLLILIVIGVLSIFWIWMLIDCLTSTLPTVEKVVWCVLIFWLHFIGAVLYLIFGRPGSRRNAT